MSTRMKMPGDKGQKMWHEGLIIIERIFAIFGKLNWLIASNLTDLGTVREGPQSLFHFFFF